MIVALLFVGSILQFHGGYTTGGWATDLGQLHYCFGCYIALDALENFLRISSK